MRISAFAGPPTFGSRAHDDEFGAFHYREMAVEYQSSQQFGVLSPDALNKLLSSNATLKERVAAALADSAYLHELRHFHDCFGTAAGLSLFRLHIKRLGKFVRLRDELKQHRIAWKLPLTKWVEREDCPSVVKHFVRGQLGVQSVVDLFLGRVPAVSQEGHAKGAWRDVRFEDLDWELPFYPYHVVTGRMGSHGEPDIRGMTTWVAIGFEALLEGNAQALQRNWLESRWPEDVVDGVWKLLTERTRTVPAQSSWEELRDWSASVVLPYTTTDFLITKVLEEQGYRTFTRDLITKLTDRALMESQMVTSSIRNGGSSAVAVQVIHPGRTFVDILSSTEWRDPLIESVRYPDNTEVLKTLREEYSIQPALEDLLDEAHGVNPLKLVESFVAQKVVVPLLDARLRHGNEVLSDPCVYLEHANKLPPPPLFINPTGFHSTFPETMGSSWWEYVMLGSIVDQLLSGKVVMSCPRAYRSAPYLQHLELSKGRSCNELFSQRECGNWLNGELDSLPDCGFRAVIQGLNLEHTAVD